MNFTLMIPSHCQLLIQSIIASIIYLILFGGRSVEARSQEIMSTKPSMENLNGTQSQYPDSASSIYIVLTSIE